MSINADTGDIVDGIDYYDPESEPNILGVEDPISAAVGSDGYIENFTVDLCVRRFPNGSYMDPERFDRYYWAHDPLPGVDAGENRGYTPVLIDLIGAANGEERERAEDAKHVPFKREWCEQNGWRYVVLYDYDALTSDTSEIAPSYGEQLRRALAPEPAAEVPVRRGPGRPRKSESGMMRPRAEQE